MILWVGITREINSFKELILQENNVNFNEKIEEINNGFYEENNCKTIAITGGFGVGKSVVSSILAKYISEIENRKTLLIDFDIFNQSISSIFEFENINGKSKIKQINSNLHVLFNIEKIIDLSNELYIYNIKELFNKLKKEYEFIIIDTSSNLNYKYIKLVLSYADNIIFLVEANLIETRKATNMLEIFINDWNINVDKIKLVFNKVNRYELVNSILEELFFEFEIISKLQYEEKYNLFINQNTNFLIDKTGYKNIYEKIKNREEIYANSSVRSN